MKSLSWLLVLVAVVSAQGFAGTIRYLYGSDIDSIDGPVLYKIDPTNGQIVDSYYPLEQTGATGVAVIGNIMYYSLSNFGVTSVYKYDLTSHIDLGLAFTIANSSGGGTSLAYDGRNLWVSDPSYSDHAYLYSLTGVLLKTVTLGDCSSPPCVGLEYFVQNGRGFLVSSEGSAYGAPSVYDIYDLNGNLVQKSLITVAGGGNWGIAWDGTHFWTADTFALSVSEWNVDGTFVATVPVTNWAIWPPYLGDLSFDYSQTLPTPEPRTLGCLATAALGIAELLRRKSLL